MLDQPGRGVGPAAQQVEHQPPRRREEQRPRRLLAQHAPGPASAGASPGTSSASQATCRPHRCACSRASGSRTWAATSSSRAASAPAHVELVGAPVRGEGGVEAVRQQLRGAHRCGPFHRLVGELDGARGLAGVGPAAGQRRRQPGPGPRRRWCGPARRTAGPAACPARRRTRRPRPRRARPGSSRRGRPSARQRVDRLVVEAGRARLPDRPRARHRPGRGDRGRSTRSPRLIVGSRERLSAVRAGSAAPPRRARAAWPRPSHRCSRWTSRRCCRPTTSARIISRQYQRWPSWSQRSSNSIGEPVVGLLDALDPHLPREGMALGPDGEDLLGGRRPESATAAATGRRRRRARTARPAPSPVSRNRIRLATAVVVSAAGAPCVRRVLMPARSAARRGSAATTAMVASRSARRAELHDRSCRR